MRRTLLSVSALSLAFPLVASAIDLTDISDIYTDARSFSKAERAGISLLTNIDVVGGNPDGTFAPRRSLNRAEFTKIALLLTSSAFEVEEAYDGRACFPDVPSDAWFAPYVCQAKNLKVVGGYPDGYFRPEQPVNYAEALKILASIYGYDAEAGAGELWYKPFADEAEDRGTALERVGFAQMLTRGEMARLGAAFFAESEGELDAYRDAEKGVVTRSSASSPASSSASSVSLVSSVSSVSSSASSQGSSAASVPFVSRSRYLLLGRATAPVIDGTFSADDEDLIVSISDLILRREIRSIDTMWLVDAKGTEIARYYLSTTDLEKRRWKAEASSAGSYKIPKGVPTTLGVKVLLKDRTSGGSSDELVEVERFSVDTVGATSGMFRQLIPSSQNYPMHLTAQSELKSVKNAGADTGTLQAGLRKVIGTFTFSGTLLPGSELRVTEVNFKVERSGVTLGRVRIGSSAEIEQADCSQDGADSTLYNCSVIPEAIDDVVPGRMLSIIADVSVTGEQGTLRVLLPDAGAFGRTGSVRWTDGSGRFNWIDTPSPLATGTLWTVTK